MKGIVESIQGVNEDNINEGLNAWAVTDRLDSSREITHFNAPAGEYLWVYENGGIMGFLTLKAIKSNFEDFDMDDEFDEVKSLQPGESWSADGENIYIRLH